MYESNCLHDVPGTMDGVPFVGVFLSDPSPYIREFRRKPGILIKLFDKYSLILNSTLTALKGRSLEDFVITKFNLTTIEVFFFIIQFSVRFIGLSFSKQSWY